MGDALIYHGTPLTPRAALNSIMPGRAGCVSFYRPDDLEALLAICPQVMFRPWGVFLLDGSHARGQGVVRGGSRRMVAGLLSVAGANPVPPRQMGDHARQPSGTIPAQRWTTKRLAIRSSRRAGLAYGRFDNSPCPALRKAPARVRRLDWRSESRAGGLRGLSAQNGRGSRPYGQHLAPAPYASRHGGSLRLPIFERGQHLTRAEWASLRLAGPPGRFVQAGGEVGRTPRIRRQAGGKAA